MKEFIVKTLKNRTFWLVVVAYLVGSATTRVEYVDREKIVEKKVEIPVERVVTKDADYSKWVQLLDTDNKLLGVCANYISSSSVVFTATSEFIEGEQTTAQFAETVEEEAAKMNSYNKQIELLGNQRKSILNEIPKN